MKKRLLSLLLSLCLVAGLFAGMNTTAYADGETQTYVVTKDDGAGVAAICAKLGVNFNANREWIQKTNKLNNAFFITPGMTLTLPAKGQVLKWVEPAAPAATPARLRQERRVDPGGQQHHQLQ